VRLEDEFVGQIRPSRRSDKTIERMSCHRQIRTAQGDPSGTNRLVIIQKQ
jgi:hypothetical protein